MSIITGITIIFIFHKLFIVLWLGLSSRLSFCFLSFSLCGPPGWKNPLFRKLLFFLLIITQFDFLDGIRWYIRILKSQIIIIIIIIQLIYFFAIDAFSCSVNSPSTNNYAIFLYSFFIHWSHNLLWLSSCFSCSMSGARIDFSEPIPFKVYNWFEFRVFLLRDWLPYEGSNS